MATQTGKKPTSERIRELYSYDQETGIFTRKVPGKRSATRARERVGAGSVSTHGYVMIAVDGTNYIAGCIAWSYVHGEWPQGRVRYRNGNKLDNRLSNIMVIGDQRDKKLSRTLTMGRLKELLHYEPGTGWFTWRMASPLAAIGDRAGGMHGAGYRMIGLDYRKYLEHHLAVFYMTGEWPDYEVDHLNNDRADNRWENLKTVTRAQNNHNKVRARAGVTGFTGVHRCGDKYRAIFNDRGITNHLGVFETIAEARAARLLAEIEAFGHCTSFKDRDERIPLGNGRYLELMLNTIDVRGQRIDSLSVMNCHGVPFFVKGLATIQGIIAAWDDDASTTTEPLPEASSAANAPLSFGA